MAEIRIYGRPKKVEKSEILKAAQFFADNQLKTLSKTVYIRIRLTQKLYKNSGHFGFAMWIDDDARNHREFDIELDAGLGPVFLLRTLAHEIVHVRQYARKELIDMCNGKYQKWKGSLISEDDIGYHDLPWEQEAAKIEKELFEQWKTINGINRKRNETAKKV